jgi:hypothetical protein
METVPQFYKYFPRIVKVEAAKCQTVVQHHAAIPDIQAADRHREILAEIPMEG